MPYFFLMNFICVAKRESYFLKAPRIRKKIITLLNRLQPQLRVTLAPKDNWARNLRFWAVTRWASNHPFWGHIIICFDFFNADTRSERHNEWLLLVCHLRKPLTHILLWKIIIITVKTQWKTILSLSYF